MPSGIYGIHNVVNDKWYIGQSQDIHRRWRQEKVGLRNGAIHRKGDNTHISSDWLKYGEDSFEWVILEYCSMNKLNDREMYWINVKDSYRNGYNQTLGGDGHRGYHKPVSQETREKISKSLQGKLKGEKHPMYGKHHTKESCEKNREAHKGVKSNLYGKPAFNRRSIICIETNTRYDCIKDASAIFGINKSNISQVCQGKRKSAGGYHWAYVDNLKTKGAIALHDDN